MKKYILTGLLALVISGSLYAQDNMTPSGLRTSPIRGLFALSWEISVPTNNDFLTATSLAGGKAEYRYFLPSKPISFGGSISWNSYEQYIGTQTIDYDNGTKAITTDMDRLIYTVPVAATAHYYFNYGKAAMPFVGLGLGVQYADQTIFYNIFEDEQYNWGFLARPEVGVLIQPGPSKNWGILLGASWSWATNKNDLFKIDNLTNFSFNIGIFLNN